MTEPIQKTIAFEIPPGLSDRLANVADTTITKTVIEGIALPVRHANAPRLIDGKIEYFFVGGDTWSHIGEVSISSALQNLTGRQVRVTVEALE